MFAKCVKLTCVVALILISMGIPEGALAAPRAQERLALSYGETVTGTIDHIRFFQQYSFEGQAGDRVVITMETLEGNLDPLLLLGDANLTLIAEDDDSAGGFNARLEIVLPESGVYVIEATRYGQDTEVGRSTGTFRLTLTGSQADSRAPAQLSGVLSSLKFGETQRGLLDAEDQFRLFWFQAQDGDRVRLQGTYNSETGATLVVYDPQLAEIGRDPSGRQLQLSLDGDGVYWAGLALNAPGAAEAYSLTLSGSVTDPQTGQATPYLMGYNESVDGVIDDASASQRYQFSGRANDQVIIRMDALQDTLDPFLYLYGPGGEIVGQDDDGGGSPNAQIAAVLPYDGTYTVVATRFGGAAGSSSGSYALGLSSMSDRVDAPPAGTARLTIPEAFTGLPRMNYGDVVGGALDDATYSQAYVIEGAAGNEVIITLENTGGNLDPLLMLMDANLNVVAEHDDISDGNKNARLEMVLPEDGYYAVLAMRYNGEAGTTSGNYRLTIEGVNTTLFSQVATLLPAADLAAGSISDQLPGEAIALLYRLHALRGDQIEIILSGADAIRQDGVLILADANLQELAVGTQGLLRHTARQDGAYILILTRQGGPLGTARGFFELTVSGADPDAARELGVLPAGGDYGPGDLIPYGTLLVENISDASYEYQYRFMGQQGDRITLRMDALDATLDPAIRVLGPDGSEILRDDNSGGNLNAFIPAYLLTADGEYTLIASRSGGRQGVSRGRFELLLSGAPVTQPAVVPGQDGLSPQTAFPLAVGQTVSGQIDDTQAAVFYVLEAQAGTTLQIDMLRAGGDLDAFLVLLNAQEALIASNDDGGGRQNARLQYTFAADGVYFVGATRFEFMEGQTQGEFLLSVVAR